MPDEELIRDMRDVAERLGKNTVTTVEYTQNGKYNSATISRRFRSWHKALEIAGLTLNREPENPSDDLLFNNIKNMWIYLGKQPSRNDIKKPISKYDAGRYDRRFGTWLKALEAFIAYINDESETEKAIEEGKVYEAQYPAKKEKPKNRTKRDISERLRFSILLRDGFKCQSCGKSPLKSRDVELHVDHIVPWSKGGETVQGNLQTKCIKCNLGKGNAFKR